MTRTIGKLADRLLSVVVPRTTALASYETRCVACRYNVSIGQKQTRYCSSGCSPWYNVGDCAGCL